MPVPKPRLTASALAASAALLLLPAAGNAATTFGSRLNHDPANSGECLGTPCSIVSLIHPIDPNGDPYAGGAPADGVIVKFRIRAFGAGGPAQVTFRLADISRPNPADDTVALATAAGSGPSVTIPADDGSGDPTPIRELPARLTVKQGQHLGVDVTSGNLWATVNDSGSKFSYYFQGPLVDGQGARGSTGATGELLVAAVVEPDIDHDGFGDETQDTCPSQGVVHEGFCQPPPPRRDTTPPAVHGLKVAGGRISYSLSEAATVRFRLERAANGRRVHRRCVRPTSKNRHSPRCTRFVTLIASFRGTGKAGTDSVALPRLHGRKLGPGAYRLTLTARDAAGNKTKTTKQFRIAKLRRR